MKSSQLVLILMACGLATGALAHAGKDTLATLRQMKVSGVDLNIAPVLQEGRNADAIRANLKAVKLPAGFKIDLYAVMPNAPHLAGQPAIYPAEQLKNYRSAKRAQEMMGMIAKPLTNAEIDNLAAWYSSLQISVQVP